MHPYVVQASVDRTTVKLLVRDFVTAGLEEKEAWLRVARARGRRRRAGRVVRVAGRGSLPQHARGDRPSTRSSWTARARQSRAPGIPVRERAIRGGTDGSRLSFMGLPTPNIFAGEQNFHSRLEWVSVQDMEKAVDVIVELARVWEERA